MILFTEGKQNYSYQQATCYKVIISLLNYELLRLESELFHWERLCAQTRNLTFVFRRSQCIGI